LNTGSLLNLMSPPSTAVCGSNICGESNKVNIVSTFIFRSSLYTSQAIQVLDIKVEVQILHIP